ncbi:hypothetical protein B0H13DRAFT_1587193 [Mycena leptocephala]|nr:hypothetical protein B0H13DRAFT_1587193 [Mycena leptocephala]
MGNSRKLYSLRAVIYSGQAHFTSRIVKPSGEVWYHDGIETGSLTESEGPLTMMPANYLQSSISGKIFLLLWG